MTFVHKLTEKMIITRTVKETTSKVKMPDGQTYEIHTNGDCKFGITVLITRDANGQLVTVNPIGKYKIGQELPNIVTTDEKVVNRDGQEMDNLYWNTVK